MEIITCVMISIKMFLIFITRVTVSITHVMIFIKMILIFITCVMVFIMCVIFFITRMIDFITSISCTLFPMFAPERDEAAAKKDVTGTAAAVAGIAVQAGSFRR
jgi:hypothetical protein